MVIHGENLATLAALKAGSGTSGQSLKVDLIYIDPPYNVGGNQGYRNVWKGKSEKERDWAGDHGSFLDFMEPRLKIGKALLKEDGIIMVSICDGEYCRLKILMDQVFGQDNCLGTIIWNKNQGSAAEHLAAIHEYVLLYARDKRKAPALKKAKIGAELLVNKSKDLKESKIPYTEAQKQFKSYIKDLLGAGTITSGESPYSLLHPKTFRAFQATPSCAQDKPETRCHKPLKHPVTKKSCKVPAKGWKWSEATLDKMAKHDSYTVGNGFVIAGQLVYGENENTVPRKLQFLDEKMEQIFPSVISTSYGGHKDLPSGVEFSTPKPVAFIKELIKAFPNPDAVVLDYFAGSGSTAQAVHELNLEDSGQRSWIMVEELGSTFNNVLMPRIDHFDSSKDYAIYETNSADVSNRELIKTFQKYSFDYLAAYHRLQDSTPVSKEGMSVLGIDDGTKRVVAMTIPSLRKGQHFFEEELALLKDAIKKSGATSALIYTVTTNDPHEEPWIGIDKSVFSGTLCKQLQIVEVPEKLVKEWEDVLAGMEAA
jgi:DNA modification methylase